MPVINHAVVHYPISLLDIGDSFFVPALAVSTHLQKMKKLAASLDYTIEYRTGIDTTTGLYGIRVIRTG